MIITDKFWVRIFFFSVLLLANYNFMGQSVSFGYVQNYFGVTGPDATWLLRGFQAGTIITSIAGLVFIKWMGNRTLFIGAAVSLLIATIFCFTATSFHTLLIARVAAGIANGFMIAVSLQMFMAAFEGKQKVVGSLYTVAGNIGGVCLGILGNSFFTEDYGWQFMYYMTVPALVAIIIFSFFIVPATQKGEEIEEDWISLIPFSVFVIALFFLVLYSEQFQGLSNPKMVIAAILVIVSAVILLIRGFLHKKPLFDTRLFQYPGFIVAIFISYMGGAVIVFSVNMVGKLLGGILGMPLKDVFHVMNLMAMTIFIGLIAALILISRKFSPFWLLIAGLLAVAYTSFTLSKLNPEFSLDNLLIPSLIGMVGSGMIAFTVILVALKTVPPHLGDKVFNFRSVAFCLGIAITASSLGRVLDFERVRNFNLMRAYTDPGNPFFQERLNGLQNFYQANGYDANQAYDAAINGMTGSLKFQSFFLAESELLLVGCVTALVLALVVFILWIVYNRQMLFNFFTFKNSAVEEVQPETGKT